MIYQLPANIHTAAACLLWSGKFDDPEDSKRNDRLKRRVKIAVLFSNLLQTLCIAALTYFVLSGGQRPQHASKWIFQVPESKEVSVVFFLAFVIAGVVLIRKELQYNRATHNAVCVDQGTSCCIDREQKH